MINTKLCTAFLIILITFSCSDKKKSLSFEGVEELDINKFTAKAESDDKLLLIYFTGIACVNCRYMEQSVFLDEEVISTVNDNYVFVPLNVDDVRDAKRKFWKKSIHSDRIISRIGMLNSEYQIELTQTGSQPYFAILNKDMKFSLGIGTVRKVEDFLSFLNNNKF